MVIKFYPQSPIFSLQIDSKSKLKLLADLKPENDVQDRMSMLLLKSVVKEYRKTKNEQIKNELIDLIGNKEIVEETISKTGAFSAASKALIKDISGETFSRNSELYLSFKEASSKGKAPTLVINPTGRD